MDVESILWKFFLCLNLVTFVNLLTSLTQARELHAPCYLCEFHHMHEAQHRRQFRTDDKETMQGDAPAKSPEHHTDSKDTDHKKRSLQLRTENQIDPCNPEDCDCGLDAPECMDGVDVVKDGCCSCLMCARQQGEDCNRRYPCDTRRGLYCHHKDPGNLHGICRAKEPKGCEIDGKTYEDGEQWKPQCRTLCTCQRGNYACSSLCPHEDFPPSKLFCEIAVLVEIPGQCCREWACTKERANPAYKLKTTTALAPTVDRECTKETTPWSSCTVSCGMGVAYRLTNDNKDCLPIKQKRLCFLRPCNMRDEHMRGSMCKSTWRSSSSVHFEYEGCKSVKGFKPKYCSTCKKNRCCTPDITKTNTVEFQCGKNTRTIMNFMWIKSCACHKTCNIH